MTEPDQVWRDKDGNEVLRITAEQLKESRRKYREERQLPLQQKALALLQAENDNPELTVAELQEFYIDSVHPDWIMDAVLWPYWCIDTIELAWDQWMRARITCSHGTYEGVSDAMTNMIGQSLLYATRSFLKDAHPGTKEDE